MFAILPAPALTDRRLLASDLRVLGAIRTFTRPDRPTCWPSRKAIGARCGITSESRISKVLGRLESLGWIQITRRQGSSVYHVFDAPQVPTGQPCTLVCSPAVHTGVQLEEIREETNYIPLTPKPEAVTLDDTAVDEPIAINPDPATTEQPDDSHEECHQGVQAAPTAGPQQAHSRPQSTPSQRQRQTPEQRQEAIQSVLDAFERASGIRYQGHATERKIGRRIDKYGLAMILAVITAKAADFQHPLCLLRPSTLEAAIAELERDNQKRLEAARDDQKRLEEIKASNRPTGDKAVGRAHLAALKRMLGKPRKPLDEVMRA